MHIRKSNIKDLPELEKIYAHARTFMKNNGNPTQWGDSYPETELLKSDIREGHSYVLVDESENDSVKATFFFKIGQDPTYKLIEDGEWISDEEYGTIHRIAVAENSRGTATECINWCLKKHGNVRIDTHADNEPMQNLLKKLDFTKCGRIYASDGTSRIAFQKKV